MAEVLTGILGIGDGALGTALTIGLFVLIGYLRRDHDEEGPAAM